MTETMKMLDRLAKTLNDASDYRIAQVLGVNRATVSKWRVGKGSFSDDTALKVAELLRDNPGYVLTVAAAERATTDETRKAWATLARRLQRSAATVAGLTVGATALIATTAGHSLQCILCYIRRGVGFVRPSTAAPIVA